MLSLCLMSFMTVAQGTIKGKIVDSQTKEPLVGATVMLEGTSEGVAADLDGSFTLKTGQTGKQTLTFRCVGYKELKKEVTLGKELNLGTIALETESIGLGDVTFTTFHFVHRHSIDHNGHIFTFEATYIYPGITESSALFRSIYTRCRF